MGPNVELETENGDIRGKHFVLGLGIDRDSLQSYYNTHTNV